MIRHMNAILWKQIKDTLKNKTILIQFLMFPVLTLIMENTVKMDGMEPNFFTNLFGVMFIGMAPLTSMASIISEEKEYTEGVAVIQCKSSILFIGSRNLHLGYLYAGRYCNWTGRRT